MQAIISPGPIKGTIQVPASKSMMQRVCAAALLHQGKTTIFNPGSSADDKAVLAIIEQLGVNITYRGDTIEIVSNVLTPGNQNIDCDESGLAARLFIPIVALSDKAITVSGKGSLLHRPMHDCKAILSQCGVDINDNNGYLPFTIKGPLQVQDLKIDASSSSQSLTGLLFAYAFAATQPVRIHVTNLTSKPYIDLTLQVLAQFGKHIRHDNYAVFHIDPLGFTAPNDISITIEADWSSASALMVAGAIAGDIKLKGLNLQSTQADKAIVNILQEAGAHIDTVQGIIHVKQGEMVAFEFDATDCPDLFPVLSILAASCEGQSSIAGIHRLLHKESNRIESIADMLMQFGIIFSIEDDTLVINGTEVIEHATIDTYNDHRIVMAAAVAALRATGTVVVHEAEAVNKSYPSFFEDLSSLGANCILNKE